MIRQMTRKQTTDLMDDHRSLTAKRDTENQEAQIKISRLVYISKMYFY